MSNEIGRNLKGYENLAQAQVSESLNSFQNAHNSINNNINSFKNEEAMAFLGTMGMSQVKISKPTQTTIKAVNEFTTDSNYVENHISFCNNLVDNGYTLQEADRITQKVFNKLKDADIYK